MSQRSTLQQRFEVWLADRGDEAILRLIFRSVLAVTIAVLALDVADMQGWTTSPAPTATAADCARSSGAAVSSCPRPTVARIASTPHPRPISEPTMAMATVL